MDYIKLHISWLIKVEVLISLLSPSWMQVDIRTVDNNDILISVNRVLMYNCTRVINPRKISFWFQQIRLQ